MFAMVSAIVWIVLMRKIAVSVVIINYLSLSSYM